MTDKHDDNGPWAKTGLVIRSDRLSTDDIGQKVGQATTNPKIDTAWVADLEPDDSMLLRDQLPTTEQFLTAKIQVLEELAATCAIELHIGWTPKVSQDGAVFGHTLIALLHRINADLIIDTYTGCEFCDPDTEPTIVVE